MTFDFKFNPLSFILLITSLILTFMLISTCNKAAKDKKANENLVNVLNDSLIRKNDTVSSRRVIQTTSPKDFTELNIKDQEVKDLQAVVEKYKRKLEAGSSVTNTKTETTVENTNKTTIVRVDTIKGKDSIAYVYPTYADSIKNEWITYRARMNKDSASLFLKVHNSYSTVIGVEKGKPFVDIINHNPYDSTISTRSYQVSLPNPKKWGIGFSGGATYYNSKFQPYIGFGVNYNIIRF